MPNKFPRTWPLCAALLLHSACFHCACSAEGSDSPEAAIEEVASDTESPSDPTSSSPTDSTTHVDSETDEGASDADATAPDDDSATDGAGATDDSATDSDPATAGNDGGATEPDPVPAGDAGEENAQPSSDCEAKTTLQIGRTYGGYTLYALRAAEDLASGSYWFTQDSETAGLGYLFKDGVRIKAFEFDVNASLIDGEQQTLVISGFFELDLGSSLEEDLSALDDSILDGCHVVEISAPIEIVAGATYGPFLVEELIVSEDLPSGTYTFSTESGNTGSVTLLRDGEVYDSLDYPWQTTIGGGASYTFDFGGSLILTVTRGMGTSNLFALAEGLFNGRHQVLVP